jgi:hypothetical protein
VEAERPVSPFEVGRANAGRSGGSRRALSYSVTATAGAGFHSLWIKNHRQPSSSSRSPSLNHWTPFDDLAGIGAGFPIGGSAVSRGYSVRPRQLCSEQAPIDANKAAAPASSPRPTDACCDEQQRCRAPPHRARQTDYRRLRRVHSSPIAWFFTVLHSSPGRGRQAFRPSLP